MRFKENGATVAELERMEGQGAVIWPEVGESRREVADSCPEIHPLNSQRVQPNSEHVQHELLDPNVRVTQDEVRAPGRKLDPGIVERPPLRQGSILGEIGLSVPAPPPRLQVVLHVIEGKPSVQVLGEPSEVLPVAANELLDARFLARIGRCHGVGIPLTIGVSKIAAMAAGISAHSTSVSNCLRKARSRRHDATASFAARARASGNARTTASTGKKPSERVKYALVDAQSLRISEAAGRAGSA